MEPYLPQMIGFLLAGFFSSTHCLFMCGGIISALTVGLPMENRQRPANLLKFVLLYNLGRLLSYAGAGFLAGFFGQMLIGSLGLEAGHGRILLFVGTLVLVGIGLHVAGWLPEIVQLERVGLGLWRRMAPLARRFIPVKKASHAVLLGVIWGWLPCGMTYSVILWSAFLADALAGAMALMVFGLGTAPSMVAASYFSGRFYRFEQRNARRLLGASIILLTLGFGLFWSRVPADHGSGPGHHPGLFSHSGMLHPGSGPP